MFQLKHSWFIVALLSVKYIEIASFEKTQKNFNSKEPQFNCSESILQQFNTSIFTTLYPLSNRTVYQYSIQYWPKDSPQNKKDAKPTAYRVFDLNNNTSYNTALRQRLPKPRVCRITTVPKTIYPIDRLKIFVINSTHAFVMWKGAKARPGANITYRTFMKWGYPDHQKIELICHSNKTNCIVKKDGLPKDFDVFVNVQVMYRKGSQLQVKVDKVGWNFIHLTWNSVTSYYGNVSYVLYMSNSGDDKIATIQEEARVENLEQYKTYPVQVKAVKNGQVVLSSGWMFITTADYDECKANKHRCDPKAWCVNTEGSYYCDSCNIGFTRNGHNCTDDDECLENKHQCDAKAECINTEGSYLCRCNKGYTGNGFNCTALSKCNEKKQMSSWNDPDFISCGNKKITNIHDQLKRNTADPVTAARQLAHLIDDKQTPLYAGDLKLVTSSLEILSSEDLLTRLGGEESGSRDQAKVNDYAMFVLNISNGILDKKLLPSWRQAPQGSAATLANKVIECNDKVALLLSNNNTKDFIAEKDNIVLSVRGIPADDDSSGHLLPPVSDLRKGTSSSIYVPASVLKHQNSKEGIRYLSYVSYKTINEVLQLEPDAEFTVLSPVISVTLTPLNRNKFDQPVVITIKQSKDNMPGEPICSFLNVSSSTDISWSSEGCEVGASNNTHIECLCYHLTSFAILMQVKHVEASAIEKEHQFALSLITYIGLCSSIVALFIVFITFAFIRFLKLPRHFIHANLALSLALAHMTFLFGINRTETKILCKALAIALHYLFLVAFTWMALEGVVLYLMLVKVFHGSMSGKKTKLIFFICGWGIPAAIVAVSSVVYHDGYGTNKFCWLSLDREFIWAFAAPVLAVIAFNFLCLGGTFYVMAKRGGNSNSENKVDKIRYWARSCCLLTCILGVTWLLGIFFVNKHSLFMAYLFSILNAFQGLMIFLLHCIGDRKIRTAYISILKCNSDPYGSSSGAKLLYKHSLGSRSGSAPSERASDDKKRLGKQKKAKSLLKQTEAVKKEPSKSVRISEEFIQRPSAKNEVIELSTYSKEDSPREASTGLIYEENSNGYEDSALMKLNPQWV